MKNLAEKAPGVALTILVAIPAWFLGTLLPVVGSPVLGILFGMLLAFFKRPKRLEDGIRFTSKKMLQTAIILLGFGMNLYQVFKVGGQTLLLMVFTLTAAFLAAYIGGRLFRVTGNTKTLIGVGTAICGGSAIAAAAPVLQASEEEVAHSISTIFLFNVIAAFLFPALGHLLHLSDTGFGLWAGTAVNDTSSVVAAGYAFSTAAGNLAVIVKLTRTLMIVPVTLILALMTARKRKGEAAGGYKLRKIFPWFVLGFLAASVVSTFVPLPQVVFGTLSQVGRFFIVMAMAAIGLNTNLPALIKKGGKPILLGLFCWAVLAVTSLAVQNIMLTI